MPFEVILRKNLETDRPAGGVSRAMTKKDGLCGPMDSVAETSSLPRIFWGKKARAAAVPTQ